MMALHMTQWMLINPSWFRVLTHRTSPQTQHLAVNAANQIFRLVEELLSSNHIHHCPIHIIPSVFAAMGMHAVDIGSGDAVREQLGYVKIELCMIALRELQDTWPVGGWIFLLFSRILRRNTNVHENVPVQPAPNETSQSEEAPVASLGWDAQNVFIPLNYPTDWDEIIHDDMWLGTDFSVSEVASNTITQ
jgi:hypothetical protein